MEENFDYNAAEAREQQILLDKGFEFSVGKRTFKIRQPYLGTLDHLSVLFLKLDMQKQRLESEDMMEVFNEQKRMINPNTGLAAKIVATAVLNSWWKIKFLLPFYTAFFKWKVVPSDLMKLTNIVLRASNLQDFTNSIALMSVTRTTAPQAIED